MSTFREGLSVEEALTKPVEEMVNGEGTSSTSSSAVNGAGAASSSSNGMNASSSSKDIHTGLPSAEEGDEETEKGEEEDEEEEGRIAAMGIEQLREEILRAREERNSFEGQYRGLLGKLTQMRSTLGDRLRQDAEELDRRELQIEALTNQTEGLSTAVRTLKDELVTSHEDVDRVTKELDIVRSSLATSQSQAVGEGTRRSTESRTRELQEMAERYRIEAEGWESSCMEERAQREELELELRRAKEEKADAERKEGEQRQVAYNETETARGLQQVLEEFQAAQDSELQRALGDHQERLERLSSSLEEYKERARKAEAEASEHKGAAERCHPLEREVKEKNLLIGKLRHEAVILNEHLTEALRRLRANSSDSNVDRRLVTNLFLQFLNTPRADAKRFEMLSLIARVLQWSDDEREMGGLQRTNGPGPAPSGSKKVGIGIRSEGKGGGHSRTQALSSSNSATGDESFSNLFVEFLLSEAEQARAPPAATSSPSAPSSPGSAAPRTSFNLGSLANLKRPSVDVKSPPANHSIEPSNSAPNLSQPQTPMASTPPQKK